MKARRTVAAIAHHITKPSDSHGPCDHGSSCKERGGHTTLPSKVQPGHKNNPPPLAVSKKAPRARTGTPRQPPADIYVKFVLLSIVKLN